MPADIITKTTEPLRIAEASATAPGFGHHNLGPVFERLLPEVAAAIVVALSTRKAVTPPWKKPCCWSSSGRRATAIVQVPRDNSESSAPTRFINPCRPTLAWMRSAIGPNSGSASARMRLLLLLVDAIGRAKRTVGTGDKRVGFAARIGAVTSREKGAAEDLGGADELADEHHRRHRQKLATGNQRRAPALDAFGKARILRALSVADVLAPFAARYLEEIAGLAPARHHPVEMGPDQPIDALPGIGHRIERGQHCGVIVPQHLQEQRTGQFLL